MWCWKFQNATPPAVVIRPHPNFMRSFIGYHGGIWAITFLGNWQKNLNILWHFELLTWESRENPKMCNTVPWKRLIVEWNGLKFGTLGPGNCIYRVLVISDSLSSVWGHSVHFVKYLRWRFSKSYCPHSFHSISTKLYGKYGNQGVIQAIMFCTICQIYFLYQFKLLTHDLCDAGNFKMLLALWFSSDLSQAS